jgi:copper resistance protein D
MTSPSARSATHQVTVAGWVALGVGAAVGAVLLVGTLSASASGTRVAATAIRAAADGAAVACVGLALLGVLLPLGASGLSHRGLRDLLQVERRADRAAAVTAGCWLLLVLAGVVVRTADALGRPVVDVAAGDVYAWATRLAAGRGLLLSAGCAAVVLGCAIARLRGRDAVQARIPLVVALLGTVLPALTGHAGTAGEHQLAVVSVGLHAAAAALWVGGLAALLVLVAPNRALLEGILPRYSVLAGGCLVAVVLTGVLSAAVRMDSWDGLVSTGYGLLVLTKALLLVLVGGLGGLTRRRLRDGRTPVLRWAGAEVALMAAAIGVAAALSQTSAIG